MPLSYQFRRPGATATLGLLGALAASTPAAAQLTFAGGNVTGTTDGGGISELFGNQGSMMFGQVGAFLNLTNNPGGGSGSTGGGLADAVLNRDVAFSTLSFMLEAGAEEPSPFLLITATGAAYFEAPPLDPLFNPFGADLSYGGSVGSSALLTGTFVYAGPPRAFVSRGMIDGVTTLGAFFTPVAGTGASTAHGILTPGTYALNVSLGVSTGNVFLPAGAATVTVNREYRYELAVPEPRSFAEIEPNDTKAFATSAPPFDPVDPPEFDPLLLPGDSLSGSTSLFNVVDYWLLRSEWAPPAIYRYRLVLAGASNTHVLAIRGLPQNAGLIGSTDVVVQASSPTTSPPRFVQWYGFGRRERLYVSFTGTGSGPAPYTAMVEREPAPVVTLPDQIVTGPITFSTIGQTSANTEFWLYTEQLEPIPGAGNDDESFAGGGTGQTSQSLLTRTLAPGVYSLAISTSNLANNLASPSDEDFRLGNVLDFPDAAVSSSGATGELLSARMSHLGGTITLPLTRTEPFEVVWVRFTVVPDTAPRPPLGVGAANPPASFNDGNSLATFTVQVAPGANPPSTGITARLNGSSIGLSSMISMRDDGLAGDAVAGDLIFTTRFTMALGTPVGMFSLPVTVSDAQGRSSASSIPFRVNPVVRLFQDFGAPQDVARTLDLTAGEIKWFRLTTSQPINMSGRFLDIDTEGSAGCPNLQFGFYRADGVLLATDFEDGSGLLPALSFGTGTRPGGTSCPTVPFGGPALPFNGRDGALAPGFHFLAVGAATTSFLPGFLASSSSSQSVPGVQVNLRSVYTPPPMCSADFNGDGNLDPDDLGDYLNCYFAAPPCQQADFNGDGNVDPDDLGDFINAYFSGCG